MLLEESTLPKPTDDGAKTLSDGYAQRRADQLILLAVPAMFAVAAALSYLIHRVLPGEVALVAAVVAGAVLARFTSRRATAPWIGVTAWITACTVATVAILELGSTGRNRIALSLAMVAIGGLLVTAVWLRRALTQGATLATVWQQTTRILLAPTNSLAPSLVGAGMALPLVGSYGPHVTDPDSAWIVASTQESRDHGIGLIQETQDVLLPHLTIGPLLATGGYRVAVPFMIATMLGLVAVTAYLGQRISGHGAGAFVTAAGLLAMPSVVARVDRLPMYAATFAFAYGSAWLLHRAMSDPSRHRWFPVAAGVGFVLSYEAHNVGQIFLLVPFLLLILHPWRRAWRPWVLALAAIAVASIPRIVVNLSVDGLSHFRNNYNTWAIQRGYLRQINQNFYGQNVEKSPVKYLSNIPGMVEAAVGGRGIFLLLAVPIILAVIRAGRRAIVFATVSAGVFFLALVIAAPATYDRYVTPLAVGFAVLAGVGVVTALKESGTSNTLGKIMVATLMIAAFYQMSATVTAKAQEHAQVTHGPLPTLAKLVDDDRRVLGIRSHELARVDPEISTLFGRKMAEEDFVTFVTWPSDDEVAALMERLDVGWVYVLPDPALEVLYNQTWLEAVYGKTVDHPLKLAASDDFCLVAEINGYRLYRYGACQPGDEGIDGLGIADPTLNPFREVAGLPLIPDPESDEYDGVPVPEEPLDPDEPLDLETPLDPEDCLPRPDDEPDAIEGEGTEAPPDIADDDVVATDPRDPVDPRCEDVPNPDAPDPTGPLEDPTG